eukprot:TRINITY_DN15606_c0_g1_i1.p1 TRINITY_DN15606_c0_g1~~TRINITY_DN15606_c0_g1_i1.p1  ORF type:complete len:255 (-),score=4.29 TRINITY_DN15606_c0_g1_i1:28-792(-)
MTTHSGTSREIRQFQAGSCLVTKIAPIQYFPFSSTDYGHFRWTDTPVYDFQLQNTVDVAFVSAAPLPPARELIIAFAETPDQVWGSHEQNTLTVRMASGGPTDWNGTWIRTEMYGDFLHAASTPQTMFPAQMKRYTLTLTPTSIELYIHHKMKCELLGSAELPPTSRPDKGFLGLFPGQHDWLCMTVQSYSMWNRKSHHLFPSDFRFLVGLALWCCCVTNEKGCDQFPVDLVGVLVEFWQSTTAVSCETRRGKK